LKEEHRYNAVTFNLARIAFYKKEFTQVIQLLQLVEYDDVFYNLVSRTFLLASYYELEEYDSLEALINSTNIYLRRSKGISEKQQRQYLSQNRFLKKLMNINQNDKNAIERLKAQLSETTGVASRPWLVEKINELL
ncbi:MAG: hypothetical protein CMN33_03260, partial [Saprospirales bacterium]|nr:hypothetical protein [Saprospirales bacterium]